MIKSWYKIYGTAKNGQEYHLADVNSKGNAHVVARALRYAYTGVRIE